MKSFRRNDLIKWVEMSVCPSVYPSIMATAVSLLTERDWRPLPLELVLGKTGNCTWGVGLASLHLTNSLALTKPLALNSICGSIPTAAALPRAVRCMKEAGQSPRDPRLPIGRKPRSNPGHGGGMRRANGAEVSSS